MKTQIVATVAGTIILTVLQIATALLQGPPPVAEGASIGFGWVLASNACIAAVLVWYARRAAWTGWWLAAALFLVPYGIGSVNALVEGYVFGFFVRPGELQALAIQQLCPALLFAPVVVWLTGRWRRPASGVSTPAPRSASWWITRYAAATVSYLVLYYTAGTIIFPYVQAFYEQERYLPPVPVVVALQVFVRVPIFVALGVLITRIAAATRAEHALMVAVAMSVLGGVAPLIIPNPYFPDAVRWVHFAEVVTSNFLFGAIVGWLFGGLREANARVPNHLPLEPSPAGHGRAPTHG